VDYAGGRFNLLGPSAPSSENLASECKDICCFGHGAVASVHAQGELVLWQWIGDTPPESLYYMAIQCVKFAGVPTAIAPIRELLAVAYGQGMVRFFQWDFTLHAEVDLHGRWINGMDVNPELGMLVTCGEDTIVNVVAVDPSGEISLPFSQGSVTKLLTGAAFLKSEPTTVALAVTAFDSYNVMLLRQ
jgi:hypothetical protein